jgi:hypothetical protein
MRRRPGGGCRRETGRGVVNMKGNVMLLSENGRSELVLVYDGPDECGDVSFMRFGTECPASAPATALKPVTINTQE